MIPLLLIRLGDATVPDPQVIDLVGSYVTTVDAVGEYRTTLDVVGEYKPVIDVVGGIDGD